VIRLAGIVFDLSLASIGSSEIHRNVKRVSV
jgi:hypothetical protein